MNLRILTILSLLIGIQTNQFAQATNIDETAICKHIEILASDEYMGRQPGTEGATKTIDYVTKQFKEIGLQPGNKDSYRQEVLLAKFSTIAPASMQLKTKTGSTQLAFKKDFLLASTKMQEQIKIKESPFVFVGFGIHAPEIGWDDYQSVDVKGKIVIVLSGSPDEYTPDSTLWKGDLAANLYGQTFYKKNEAARRGAIGLLSIYKQSKQGFYTWESIANYVGQNNWAIQKTVEESQLDFSGVLNKKTVQSLFELANRPNYDYQKAALKPNFQAFSLNISAQFTFSNTWETLTTHNVVGLLPGTDLKEEVMLYTAHWDHVGVGTAVAGDSIRNGAVDNASGTAALIEIAQAFKQQKKPPRRSVLFMATAAEEMGLLGAVWYAAHPLFSLGQTAASFNMDAHFPYGKTTHITGVVYGRSGLDPYLKKSAELQGRILVPNTEQNIAQNIFFRSDHFPLAEVGIPSEFAVGAGEAKGHDNTIWEAKMGNYASKYHQPSDEYEADFDCAGIAQDAELVMVAGQMMDKDGAFPMWNANQPFQRYRQQSRQQILDIKKIEANFEEQAACWNRGDLVCYMKAYVQSEDMQTISRNGVTKGYDKILGNYQKYFPKDKMGQLFFDEFQYKRLSDTYYYVVGRFNLKYEKEGGLRQGWFSVLMQKVDEEWLILSDHSS